MGLSYASACLADAWALFNNPAGLTGEKQPSAFFSYEAHPGFSPFNRMAAGFSIPTGPGVTAAGVYRFGDDLYNEQIISAAFANTLGIASLGIKVNYIQYHIEGFGNTAAITLSMGGIARLTPHLSIGAHIININQPNVTKVNEEKLTTILLMGLGLTVSDKVFVTTEIEKDLVYDLTWKSGLEYKVHKNVTARTGFNIKPQAGVIGLGWRIKKFKMDYAFQYMMSLGAVHQATINYQFKQE